MKLISRTILSAGLFFLILISAQNAVYSYTFHIIKENPFSQTGIHARWNLNIFKDKKIPYFINPNRPVNSDPVLPEETTVEEVTRDIQNGFQVWENIDTSNVKFAFQGITERSESSIDGTNLVTMNADPFGEGNCGTAFTRVVTCQEAGLCRLSNGKFVTVEFPGQIIDADIVFCTGDDSETLSIDGSGDSDIQGRTTHEAGHFLGFAHTGVLPDTMYGYVGFDNIGVANKSRRTLSKDDVIATSIIYPESGYLKSTGSVKGSVIDEDLNPVFGAQVVAVNFDGVIVASALTGVDKTDSDNIPQSYSSSSGDFIINGLPPDLYDLYVEPLDGPPAGATNSGFFDVTNINLNFNTTHFSHTVAVDADTVTKGVDFQVMPLNQNAPNIDVLSLTDTLSGPIASGIGLLDEKNTLRIGIGSNVAFSDKLLAGTTFEISGDGVSLTAEPFITGNFISIPFSVDFSAVTGARNVTATTDKGISILGGGLKIAESEPLILSINPDSASPGSFVSISGNGFSPDTIVSVQGKVASAITVNSPDSITIKIPSPFIDQKIPVDIEVRNDAGFDILRGAFTFLEPANTDNPIPSETPNPEFTPTAKPSLTPDFTLTPFPSETPLTPTASPTLTEPLPVISPTPKPIIVLTTVTVEPNEAESSIKFNTVVFTALDQFNNPIQGLIVRTDTNGLEASVFPESATTSSNGKTQFKFRFKHFARKAEITFSTGGLKTTLFQK